MNVAMVDVEEKGLQVCHGVLNGSERFYKALRIFVQDLHIEEKLDTAQCCLEKNSCDMQNNNLRGSRVGRGLPF